MENRLYKIMKWLVSKVLPGYHLKKRPVRKGERDESN
jgi:hypothetical protein